jgi:hypothetical protein
MVEGNDEYVCRDFNDFFKYKQHCSALIIDTDEIILCHSEESKYDIHD